MRLLLCALGLSVAVVAVGCGGEEGDGATSTQTTTVASASQDPGLDAVRQMIRAVGSHDRVALWGLLSAPARRGLGPTLPAFRRRGGRELERRLRYFAAHPYRMVVSERITGRFGLIAIASGRIAFAAPLRLEHGTWKLEPGRGPLAIRAIGPEQGSVGRVRQIAYEVTGTPEGATAVLYVDGVTLLSKEAATTKTATVYSNLDAPLTPGLHNTVAFATHGDAAVAKAWTFLAR
jgi:hypothetical protein